VESRFVHTNGIRLHVIDHGGSGPTLVLTPGLTANARFFDAVVGGLGDGVRVVAVDLRGRGLSDKPDTGYSMSDHAADIVGLVDVLGGGPIVMGGHSFGGLLTYFLATHHPEVVDRCVVLDAPVEVDPTIVEQIKPSLARLDSTMPSFADYLAAVRSQPYFADWWDPAIEAYYRADVEGLPDGRVKPRSHPDHIQQAIEATLVPDWPRIVTRIDQPTLVVRARGPFGPPGSPPILAEEPARTLVESLPDGRLVEVDGNHITGFFGESAPVVANAIRSFVLEAS
jgi:pimeloyl-ACP methyl ester carboxylesterase